MEALNESIAWLLTYPNRSGTLLLLNVQLASNSDTIFLEDLPATLQQLKTLNPFYSGTGKIILTEIHTYSSERVGS